MAEIPETDGVSPEKTFREIGASKRAHRRKAGIEATSEEKLRLLDALRTRSKILKGEYQAASPSNTPPRFGGRSTAAGTKYEERVAAFLAVQMLAGSASVWSGVVGSDITAITMQAPAEVDDIVVELKNNKDASAFISVKYRSSSIPLTSKSSAFVDVVASFVKQFCILSSVARMKSRFVWAVPSTAGRAVTIDLLRALEAHRRDSGDDSLETFLARRQFGEKLALSSFIEESKNQFEQHLGSAFAEEQLRAFLKMVYVEEYDFESGSHLERRAVEYLNQNVVEDRSKGARAWEIIEALFADASRRGLRIDSITARKALTDDSIGLQAPVDYAADVGRLREITDFNLKTLSEHSRLRFGPTDKDVSHIDRAAELSALEVAGLAGSLLLTGEPGSGKSGLIHDLVDRLKNQGVPVVLLLAEDLSDRDGKGAATMPGLSHPLATILKNWPNATSAILITDALDAVRDASAQKALRHLLREVQEGETGWQVLASVREFDLKHSHTLREAFPGNGVEGYTQTDFVGVAHFHLPVLNDAQLEQLAVERPIIKSFINGAKGNSKVTVHRLPFYLQLAAQLLRHNVPPERLADWNSPAILLRKYWSSRLGEDKQKEDRESVLRLICERMVTDRTMIVSKKDLSLDVEQVLAINDLRSIGILQSPRVRNSMLVGDEEIRFAHHLLYDYAIARTLIPTTEAQFCSFVINGPLLPIYFRQSFRFALEELWDADDTRTSFWASAFRLEEVPNLNGITRLLAPSLAASRVLTQDELEPLAVRLEADSDSQSPGWKALYHLTSGLHDTDPTVIRAAAAGWSTFVRTLSGFLPHRPQAEGALIQMLGRLVSVGLPSNTGHRLSINAAGRALLAYQLSKETPQRRPNSRTVIEVLCRTFNDARKETEISLMALLTEERLLTFPEGDLFSLAHELKHLGPDGQTVVVRMFEGVFAAEPDAGEWEQMGGRIMGMQMQTSDLWHGVQYALADYYVSQRGDQAGFLTELACIAWNSVSNHRPSGRSPHINVGQISFRGIRCELVEDYSHIWGRTSGHEGSRIIGHFEQLLRGWAMAGDTAKLNETLDVFVRSNQSALLWSMLLEVASEYPLTFGLMMEEVLSEPLILSHPDYAYGSAELLGSLHRTGDTAKRTSIEKLILDLPSKMILRDGESRVPPPARMQYAQNRLLGVLKEEDMVLAAAMELRRAQEAVQSLPANQKRDSLPEARWVPEREDMERRGIDLQTPDNEEAYRLRDVLKKLFLAEGDKFVLSEVELHWPALLRSAEFVETNGEAHPELMWELWGYLVAACSNLASLSQWPATDERWKIIRKILLKASTDPRPPEDRSEVPPEHDSPSWGWPAPRIDAACGLPFLALRLHEADAEVKEAMIKLSEDKNSSLRFNLARRLAVLQNTDPDLMWELIEGMLRTEKYLMVLAALTEALDHLWAQASDRVLKNLAAITGRVEATAPAKHHARETLSRTHLFHFLRTGEPSSKLYIDSMIDRCDAEGVSQELAMLLHHCRDGGWLTADDDDVTRKEEADQIRGRTWGFVSQLLEQAQNKLHDLHEALIPFQKAGSFDSADAKLLIQKRDRLLRLVDTVATQIYFGSGAFDDKRKDARVSLTDAQLKRFWFESKPIFKQLVKEVHPHVVHQIVQTLKYLLPCAPAEIFLLAAEAIRNGEKGEIQHEALAADEVVLLIQQAIADHREIFQNNSDGSPSPCLVALLRVLDLFVEAGWEKARQLTHRLEDIYR